MSYNDRTNTYIAPMKRPDWVAALDCDSRWFQRCPGCGDRQLLSSDWKVQLHDLVLECHGGTASFSPVRDAKWRAQFRHVAPTPGQYEEIRRSHRVEFCNTCSDRLEYGWERLWRSLTPAGWDKLGYKRLFWHLACEHERAGDFVRAWVPVFICTHGAQPGAGASLRKLACQMFPADASANLRVVASPPSDADE